METELKRCREKLAKEHRVPSIGEATEQTKKDDTRHGMPSTATRPEPFGEPTRYVVLPNVKTRKNYAEAVQGNKKKTYKMTVKSTGAHPPDTIKQIPKSKINLKFKIKLKSGSEPSSHSAEEF
jgi:hypothetical protein